uniref:Ig-like domain-containing protein n=1 Tax=Salvator merianae TaxID=96440 RepID=A0A8D0BPR5_SALMN
MLNQCIVCHHSRKSQYEHCLCPLPQGSSWAIYAEKGTYPELPCPCSTCSKELRKVSWLFAQKDNTVLLFEKLVNGHITRFPPAGSRLNMLQNYSLQFSNVTGEDSGRYWCDAHYYDLVVNTNAFVHFVELSPLLQNAK